MIFSSLQYLLFLPIVAILYWRTRGKARLALVVVASYIFYMSWLPVYGILLFILTTANWLIGLGIEGARNTKRATLCRMLLLIGLLGNLGCLCYYKYTNFLMSNLVGALGRALHIAGGLAGVQTPLVTWSPLEILLPLGISFFVFEFVHYIADVYKGCAPVKSWLEFAAFAAFFPSQIAGPIKRYQEFIDGLRAPMPLTGALFGEAGALIVQGLFKKVAIADPISGVIATSFLPNHVLSCPDALIASVGFVIQVYCDFSGYTDIGRGSALLLGIRLPVNFALPFLAVDLAEFWRRWHMSLSFWLRDYVYIPLGGSRGSRWLGSRNLFVTMVACGLWHGAAWHYIVFGCVQGIGMAVHREWKNFLKLQAATSGSKWTDSVFARALGLALTMAFTISTFSIFRAPDVPTAINVLSAWFAPDMSCTLWEPILKSGVLCLLSVYMLFWVLTESIKHRFGLRELTQPVYPAAIRYASWTAALFLIVAARPTVATPFVYFQF